MVIKPGSLFRKVYTGPRFLNSGLHISSMCYCVIKFMVLIALYWHLISVNTTLVNYSQLNRD